jgi:AraC-like DNA-binding protein
MHGGKGELLFSRGIENDDHFHVISRQSSIHSIRFEIGIPDSFIDRKLQAVRNQILLFTCLTAVFVVFLSLLFAWRSSLPERSFLKRIEIAGITHARYNLFSSLKRTYLDLADVISAEKSHLEISQRTIEAQTALIRTQTIDRIRKALLLGDEVVSRTILRDCVATLPSPEDPLIAALLSRMLSAMIQDLREELPGIIPPMEPLEHIGGSQEKILEYYYPDYFTRICESVRIHKEENISTLRRNVLAFINEHLYDPNMYITMAADHFKISAPTLQKLVKQCTGQTFLTYVEKNRLDRTCELLQGSTYTISQIAIRCGFSSGATFSRSFKRIYGFPPSRLQETQSM